MVRESLESKRSSSVWGRPMDSIFGKTWDRREHVTKNSEGIDGDFRLENILKERKDFFSSTRSVYEKDSTKIVCFFYSQLCIDTLAQISTSSPKPTLWPPAFKLRASNNPDRVNLMPKTSCLMSNTSLGQTQTYRDEVVVETTDRLDRCCSL